MAKAIGSFSFVLHSHLPYVLNHGVWPHGTDWIFEASVGCYLPLLKVFRDLKSKGISSNVTLGITPVLAEQLADSSFQDEFSSYLSDRIGFAQKNKRDFLAKGQNDMAELSDFWLKNLKSVQVFYERELEKDIIGAFRELFFEKNIELITSAATHGYFPLLGTDASLRLQTSQGVRSFERHFGKKPLGIWLPECAYRPAYSWKPPVGDEKAKPRVGVEEILAEFGLRYFITDSHMLEGGKAIGTYLDRFKALLGLWERYEKGAETNPKLEDKSTLESYWVAKQEKQQTAAAVFARDPETALTVWSAEVGYPGDGWYLDFHKKHFPGGLKYWRVTKTKSDLADKKIYEPLKIEARLNENAEHFVGVIKKRLNDHYKKTGQKGHLTAPFDTELFGHWWFEGPQFIKKVIEILAQDSEVDLISCGERLINEPPKNVISLPEGSWGQGGFHWIWFNEDTQWTWKHLYECEKIMTELCSLAYLDSELLNKIVTQAGRELLLLEASDWQFLISTWSARDYAELRFSEHVACFKRLAEMAEQVSKGVNLKPGDLAYLDEIISRDSLFPDLDISDFR